MRHEPDSDAVQHLLAMLATEFPRLELVALVLASGAVELGRVAGLTDDEIAAFYADVDFSEYETIGPRSTIPEEFYT